MGEIKKEIGQNSGISVLHWGVRKVLGVIPCCHLGICHEASIRRKNMWLSKKTDLSELASFATKVLRRKLSIAW